MKTENRHLREKFAADVSSLKRKRVRETKIVESDRELSSYAHCKLPEHYFDMLLYKKQENMPVPGLLIEQSGVMHYR